MVDVLLQPLQADDMLHPPRQEQVIDHVEHQQRLHGIIREALAGLSEAEVAEPLGVAEEGAVVAVALFENGRGGGNRYRLGFLFWRAPNPFPRRPGPMRGAAGALE